MASEKNKWEMLFTPDSPVISLSALLGMFNRNLQDQFRWYLEKLGVVATRLQNQGQDVEHGALRPPPHLHHHLPQQTCASLSTHHTQWSVLLSSSSSHVGHRSRLSTFPVLLSVGFRK